MIKCADFPINGGFAAAVVQIVITGPSSPDILIAGGGVIGLMTARELALAGARVTVLDQRRAGQASSWAGGGILSPLYPWRQDPAITRLVDYSQSVYPQLAAELQSRSGVDPQWTRSGLLVLDSEIDQATEWARPDARACESVTRGQIAGLEPALAPAQADGIWMPEIAQVRNPRLVKALAGALPDLGIRLEENRPVTGLMIEGGCIKGVRTAQGDLAADAVIIAAGAWSGQDLDGLVPAPGVRPVRGQMILFRAAANLLRHITLRQDRYLIPRRDGRILAGSTLEHADFDTSTTGDALRELRGFATDLVPALADVPVEHHWAGLRPGNERVVPFIAAHPEVDGLYVNTGHYRNGLILAPASARLMADLVLDREPVVDPEPYGLNRA